MDALCLMIKNNSYLGAGKAFAQTCCLLVSSLNVLLISTQLHMKYLEDIYFLGIQAVFFS